MHHVLPYCIKDMLIMKDILLERKEIFVCICSSVHAVSWNFVPLTCCGCTTNGAIGQKEGLFTSRTSYISYIPGVPFNRISWKITFSIIHACTWNILSLGWRRLIIKGTLRSIFRFCSVVQWSDFPYISCVTLRIIHILCTFVCDQYTMKVTWLRKGITFSSPSQLPFHRLYWNITRNTANSCVTIFVNLVANSL
jgi:hypothetical protein